MEEMASNIAVQCKLGLHLILSPLRRWWVPTKGTNIDWINPDAQATFLWVRKRYMLTWLSLEKMALANRSCHSLTKLLQLYLKL
jgi:hypothetical protein